MKLFDVQERKNFLLYLITPYFIKAKFFTPEDKLCLEKNNEAWNRAVNAAAEAISYDERHGYTSGEGSGYPLFPILESYFPKEMCLGSALDIGAGSGFLTSRLAANSSRWVALEFVPELIEQIKEAKARNSLGQVEVLSKSIFNANFSEGEFDTIFLFNTMHHLINRDVLISRIYRWLKPGGKLYLLEPRHNLQRVIQLARKYFTIYRKEKKHDFTTHDFLSKIELRQLFRTNGFSNIQINPLDFPLIQKLFKNDRTKQYEFEKKINCIPVIEHFGRFLFAKAVKSIKSDQ